MDYTIDTMRRADWAAVRAIYGEGLATGLAAFMTDPPGWPSWHAGHLTVGRLVARDAQATGSAIFGFSALAPVPDT